MSNFKLKICKAACELFSPVINVCGLVTGLLLYYNGAPLNFHEYL